MSIDLTQGRPACQFMAAKFNRSDAKVGVSRSQGAKGEETVISVLFNETMGLIGFLGPTCRYNKRHLNTNLHIGNCTGSWLP
jgi:hypothetical protein